MNRLILGVALALGIYFVPTCVAQSARTLNSNDMAPGTSAPINPTG